MCGLLERDFRNIYLAIKQFPEIDKVVIFGSRALGNYKKGSDIDLSIYGNGINRRTILTLSDLLNEEYPIPYFFDIIHYESINNENLKSHIDKYGKVIYEKDKS